MNPKYLIVFILLLGLNTFLSCKKLVEVGAPVNQLTTSSVFTNDNTAIAAQLAIYAQMQAVPWTIEATTALSSDELANYSTPQSNTDLYDNALNAQADGNSLQWAQAYNFIYQENAIIENVQKATGITNNTKTLLIAEAQFVRAYWYFYLVGFYGDVPLITSTDYKKNSAMSRTPRSKVYQQILQDLRDAQLSLKNVYLDATDTAVTVDRVRPTTWAASALLARAYLYNGQYDSAEIQSTRVINNSVLFGLVPLNSVFLKNSNEAIWQIYPPSAAKSTYEGTYFILTGVPGGGSLSNCCAISPQLLSAFESGDNRKSSWINSYTNGSKIWSFPYKYKDNGTNSSLREYSMVLRLGEQYLIRADARARQNKLNDAISDINAIRTRAGLAGLNPLLSQQQALSAIAHERQVELFMEGDRWFDLKRNGAIDSVMSVITPTKGGIAWNTNQQLYPIGTSELQNGVNLAQNLGY
jgi:hypothetical protein